MMDLQSLRERIRIARSHALIDGAEGYGGPRFVGPRREPRDHLGIERRVVEVSPVPTHMIAVRRETAYSEYYQVIRSPLRDWLPPTAPAEVSAGPRPALTLGALMRFQR